MVQDQDEDKLYKSWLKFENKFCPMPFLHLFVETTKEVRLCCQSKESLGQIDVNFDYNNKKFQDIRKKFLNNEPLQSCNFCYEKEKQKILSLRMESLKNLKENKTLLFEQVKKFNNGKGLQPYWYELRISNNCNLACLMCNKNFSSTIAKNEGYKETQLSFEPDIDINPNAIKFNLSGGEPFLIKKFVKFLQQCENKDCEIQVQTNATFLSKNLLDELSKFKNVSITLSIDGFNEINQNIRINSKWEEIDKNIDVLLSYNFYLSVNTTVQKLNLYHLNDLADYLKKKNILNWYLHPVLNSPKNDYMLAVGDIENLHKLFQHDLIKNNFINKNLLTYIIKRLESTNG